MQLRNPFKSKTIIRNTFKLFEQLEQMLGHFAQNFFFFFLYNCVNHTSYKHLYEMKLLLQMGQDQQFHQTNPQNNNEMSK